MSLRDTFVRVNRHRALDPRAGRQSLAAFAIEPQVWAIAADEGEQDGNDVLVDGACLTPAVVLMSLPRHPSITEAVVREALAELFETGGLSQEGPLVRVRNLAAYNERRFRERARLRAKRKSVAPLGQTLPHLGQRCPDWSDVAEEQVREERRLEDSSSLQPPHASQQAVVLSVVGSVEDNEPYDSENSREGSRGVEQPPSKPKKRRQSKTKLTPEEASVRIKAGLDRKRRVDRFLGWFSEKHKAHVGASYLPTKRDRGAAWRLLTALDTADLAKRAEALLTTRDRVLTSKARDVMALEQNINHAAVLGLPAANGQTTKAHGTEAERAWMALQRRVLVGEEFGDSGLDARTRAAVEALGGLSFVRRQLTDGAPVDRATTAKQFCIAYDMPTGAV